MLSVLKLLDVNGEPMVKLDLPPLRIGELVALRFRVERRSGGRVEHLHVNHRFRVTAVGCDASCGPARQVVSVEHAEAKPPTWKSVKRAPEVARKLSPAIFPRTPV